MTTCKRDKMFIPEHYEPVFPWFGGKRRVAKLIWRAFGADIPNYVEPFFGSGAVLFQRPTDKIGIETVNDKDGFVCNAWRAIKYAPDEVAYWADWPVNENDLHARHFWLKQRRHELSRRLEGDPEYFDARIAGWWMWGMCASIGGAFCLDWRTGPWTVVDGMLVRISDATNDSVDAQDESSDDDIPINRSRPHLGRNSGVGRCTNDSENEANALTTISRSRPHLSSPNGVGRSMPALCPPMGVTRHNVTNPGVSRSIFDMAAESGVIAKRRNSCESDGHSCVYCCSGRCGLVPWMNAISARLRNVRVTSGDWTRVLGHSPTTYHGVTGLFFDPPYSAPDRASVYGVEDFNVANDVREWCKENGNNPLLRIALCGYEGEAHDELLELGWTKYAWKAHGGYGSQNENNVNMHRERIWFSPACLPLEPQAKLSLFDEE